MKKIIFISLSGLLCLAAMKSNYSYYDTESPPSRSENENISSENFDVMMKVITHERCMNCHPSDDRPRQGDESSVHHFDIQRGADGHGMPALKCSTCHQSENNDLSGVPGAPHWHLAPKSMGWQGLNRVEIADAMLDKTKNGGRSLEEIEEHLTEDALVLWAFEPGVNNEGKPRKAPPVSKEAFIAAVKNWIAEGAKIPAK